MWKVSLPTRTSLCCLFCQPICCLVTSNLTMAGYPPDCEFAAVIVELIRYCPEVVFAPARAITMGWLSMYSEMVFPIVSGIFLVIHVANSALAASASYVLCLVLGPRYSFIVFTGRANPFLYSMADAPIPLSCPEPSEKTLKSAISYHSYEIESSLDLAITVVYLLFSALLCAVGSIVSSIRFLILKILSSWSSGLWCLSGGFRLAFLIMLWRG